MSHLKKKNIWFGFYSFLILIYVLYGQHVKNGLFAALKARHKTNEDSLGGRTGVRDTVSDPARGKLHLQVHHSEPGGHAMVACAQLLA